jgi:large subunit ribosomal protein L25
MTEHKQLTAQERTVFGRQVKQLRDTGLTPANIYSAQSASTAIMASAIDLKKLLDEVGESEIIELTLDKESKPRPVLVSGVQRDPVSRTILHVDFRQVDLTKEVTVSVAIVFEGESPATKTGEAVVLELMNEIEVTALPDNLPSEIVIDVSRLENVGDQITVADLTLPEGVIVEVEDPEQPICKVDAIQIKEEEIEEPTETAAEGEEGAAPAEGEEPAADETEAPAEE